MKEYKTYQARNAVKAALVTNHIKARKKQGVSHLDAKIEAYVKYDIKKGKIILKRALARELGVVAKAKVQRPVPAAPPSKLPPLPTGDEFVNALPPLPVPQVEKPALPKPDLFKSLGLPPLPPLPSIGA